MGINLINDNLVAANARALFARSNNSASVAVGAYLPCFLTANSRSFNEGNGFRSTGVGVDGAEEIEVLFDGVIEVSGIFNFVGSGHATTRLDMVINGVYHSIISFARSNLTAPTAPISGSAKVQKGDLIKFQNQSTAAVTIDDNGRYAISRVSDYSAGQPAGFGLASSSVAGLVGGTNGVAIPSGRLFESKEFTWANVSINGAQALSMGSVSLEKGNWLLLAQSQYQTNAGAPTEGQITGNWNTTGGVTPTGVFGVDYSHALVIKLGFTTNYNGFLSIAPKIVNLTTTTTYHLNIFADNTGTGTSALHGKATAIKIG